MQRGVASCGELLDQVVEGLGLAAGAKIVLVDMMMNRCLEQPFESCFDVIPGPSGFMSSAKQSGRSRRSS